MSLCVEYPTGVGYIETSGDQFEVIFISRRAPFWINRQMRNSLQEARFALRRAAA